MFSAAIDDKTRMPPRCCHFIQIHAAIRILTPDQAKAYRAKFEEWITTIKVYCPSPTCSAFIPERRLPVTETEPRKNATQSLSAVLREVVETVVRSPEARFFRGETPSMTLPGYKAVVKQPMCVPHIHQNDLQPSQAGNASPWQFGFSNYDAYSNTDPSLSVNRDLGMIQIGILDDLYTSTSQLTAAMSLIVTNAVKYNGAEHPVSKAADKLFIVYLSTLGGATDRLAKTPPTHLPPTFFACPDCHIAICTDCKQVEHSGAPCDTSQLDYEVAMLEQFGYVSHYQSLCLERNLLTPPQKRCPSCKAAVKKMFGCYHMQCRCGAHWCYNCQRSKDQCDGGCGEDDEYDSDEDEDEDEEEVSTVG